MADANLHEVQFQWPYVEPTTVIITGTFDGWSKSIYLKKTSTGFEGTAKIPWDETIKYKFIVDGQWLVNRSQPIDVERGSGFVNNIYTAPPRPAPISKPAVLPPVPTVNGTAVEVGKVNGHSEVAAKGEKAPNGYAVQTNGNGNSTVSEAASSDKAGVTSGDKSEQKASESPRLPQLLSNLASTIVAGHGTNSAFDYVSTGLGAAVHSVIGVDPINGQKIALPTPKAEDKFDRPFDDEPNTPAPQTATTTTKATFPATPVQPTKMDTPTPASPVAPIVPITIVPVNAPENSTVPSSSPPTESVVAAPVAVAETTPPVGEVVNGDSKPAKEAVPKVEEPSTHAPIVVDAGATPIVSDLTTAQSKPADVTSSPAVPEEPKVASTTSATPAKESLVTDSEPGQTKDKSAVAEATSPAVLAEAPKTNTSTTETKAAVREPESSKSTSNDIAKTPPVTPTKAQVFPASADKSPTSSPSKSPSRFSSMRSKKRNSSIISKLKDIFTKDKEKEKTKEKK